MIKGGRRRQHHLAAEAGPDRVRVNCIQPGIVEGERVERIIAAKAAQLGVSSNEVHISGQAISVCGGARYLV